MRASGRGSWRTGGAGRKLLVRVAVSGAALVAADLLLDGFRIDGWPRAVALALLFGLANAYAKPLLRRVAGRLLTLALAPFMGLVLFVLNLALFGLLALVANQTDIGVSIAGWGTALLGSLLVALVSWALARLLD